MGDDDRLASRDALAAEMFPERWALVATAIGKRAGKARHNIRRQAEVEQKLRALRADGRSCAGCSSFKSAPHGMRGRICEANSDFHGYAIVKAGDLCTDWMDRAAVALKGML